MIVVDNLSKAASREVWKQVRDWARSDGESCVEDLKGRE
jgi:hypothetical protein